MARVLQGEVRQGRLVLDGQRQLGLGLGHIFIVVEPGRGPVFFLLIVSVAEARAQGGGDALRSGQRSLSPTMVVGGWKKEKLASLGSSLVCHEATTINRWM